MPGASEQTRRVKIVNANWVPGTAGRQEQFEVMIITEDDQRHVVPASAASVTAVVTLARALILRGLIDEREPVYRHADLTIASRDVPHEKIVEECIEALHGRLCGEVAPPEAAAGIMGGLR